MEFSGPFFEYCLDAFEEATTYVRLCRVCERVRRGCVVVELDGKRPVRAAEALWNIALRLLPQLRDESKVPDESLFSGDAPVTAAGRVDTSAHRLIRRLAVESLEKIILSAGKAVPEPHHVKWPSRDALHKSGWHDVLNLQMKALVRLLQTEPQADAIAASILGKLKAGSLPDDFHERLAIETMRADRRMNEAAPKEPRRSNEDSADPLREMIPVTQCLDLFHEKVSTDKQLRALLARQPDIRRCKPNPRRLFVNVADLARYFAHRDRQTSAALDAAPLFAAEAQARLEAIRQQKRRERGKQS